MGFSLYYRSTRPIAPGELDAIERSASIASLERTWLRCEPVHFFPLEADGHLMGGSKPNFQPHPTDVAGAQLEGHPDGTCRDLLDVLCDLSREHQVDWSIGHDHDPEIGFIRGGSCDAAVRDQVEAFADLGDILGDLDPDGLD